MAHLQKVSHGADALINEHEEQYLLDYESDSERGVGSVATAHGTEGVSSANLELMVKYDERPAYTELCH